MNQQIQEIIVYAVIAGAVIWCVVKLVKTNRHKGGCSDCPLSSPGGGCSCHRKKEHCTHSHSTKGCH